MSDLDDRRSIEEIKMRYKLEPELDDLYVEGAFDKELLTYFLSSKGSTKTIYEIDTIDLPMEKLVRHGLSDGQKQRVICLALELKDLEGVLQYRCLVDKDLDHWLNNIMHIPRLKWTEFCTLELHLLTKPILETILKISCKAKIDDFDLYIKTLFNTLKKLYAMRLADRELEWKMTWIDYEKYLSFDGNQINFDDKKYMLALLLSNHKSKQLKNFEQLFSNWESKLKGDIRNSVRGHDLTDLLSISVKKFKGLKSISTPEAIERLYILLAKDVETINYEIA